MGKPLGFWTVICALPVVGALLACEQGGANPNQKGVGNQPGGVELGLGDIAVAPVGNYVLFNRGTELAVGWIDSGTIDTLPVSSPSRLAFSKKRSVVYVTSDKTGELVAVDATARTVLWRASLDDSSSSGLKLGSLQGARVESSPDDRYVLAAGSRDVEVFDAQSGARTLELTFPQNVVDVQILPDSRRALVVEQHEWQAGTPETHVVVLNLDSNLTTAFDVPNCSDKVVVSADGSRGFLAPTTCSKDPVSVLDLKAGEEGFERNLPGFGPVALAPHGTTAVAFFDTTQADPSLFDDPAAMPPSGSARYQLMLIDTSSLAYRFVPVGSDLPRFAITPDGNVLLVDSTYNTATVRLLDVDTERFVTLRGPLVQLDDFTLSSDSKHAYVLQNDVFDLDIPNATVSHLGLDFTPQNINISADDRYLFLRENDQDICIYEIATRTCRAHFLTVAP